MGTPKHPLITRTLTYDPAEMALRGRIGAHRLHATHDPRETTKNARTAFLARFEREVDPNGELPEEERQRRAQHARKAHFARLALKSAIARARKQTNRNAKRDAAMVDVAASLQEVSRVSDASTS